MKLNTKYLPYLEKLYFIILDMRTIRTTYARDREYGIINTHTLQAYLQIDNAYHALDELNRAEYINITLRQS